MRVTQLWVYPVKSCRGVRVDRVEVVRRGLQHDRRWMIVDDAGRFLTQREEPRMALLRCQLDAEGTLVTGPAGEPLRLPHALDERSRTPVVVWDDRVPAAEFAPASRWFSAQLGRPVRAVWMPDDTERQVDPKRARPGDLVSFADGFPMLVVSQASLDELNRRLAHPVEMERFRPNIVVDGVPPHAEDGWTRLRLGAISFRAVKPCARCTIPTIDPERGVKGQEPLRTLATYRARGNAVFFGMNLVHDGTGLLQVGDEGEAQ